VDVQAVKNNVKVCMFDQYGTAVAIQGGPFPMATRFLKERAWTGAPTRL